MVSEDGSQDRFASRKATILAAAVAIASVVIPFWFWMDTWFGKPLTDERVGEYLTDNERPRRAQHAMAQISQRLAAGDETVKQWYPELLRLARHELPEIRVTVAWLMGDDPSSDEFHAVLADLLQDKHPMVRRNAALALAKFRDPSGRSEMRAMLQIRHVASEHAGTVLNRLTPGDSFDAGALLVRIEADGLDEPLDVRAMLPGIVDRQLHADGDRIEAGENVTIVRPEETHVRQALLGLYLVGTEEDIDLIRPFTRPREGFSPQVAQQASLTLEHIRAGAGSQAGSS